MVVMKINGLSRQLSDLVTGNNRCAFRIVLEHVSLRLAPELYRECILGPLHRQVNCS